MEDLVEFTVALVLLLILLLLFLLPSIIAFVRRHHYRWIIFAINVFGSFIFGSGWLIAFIWSVWPSDTGVLDPVINDPTSNSRESNKEIYTRYGENCKSFSDASNGESHLEGEVLSESESKPINNICPNCGKLNDEGAKYCNSCGCKLS